MVSTAGTREILKIHGYGYVEQQNNCEIWFNFADKENTSFTHPESDIRLWSDILIKNVLHF